MVRSFNNLEAGVIELAMSKVKIIQNTFGVRSLSHNPREIKVALYLQVSIVSQTLIFVTRSRSWSYAERPVLLLMSAFLIAQLETHDSLEDAISEMSQLVAGFTEDASASNDERLDPTSEGWIADCFNDAEMQFRTEKM